MVFHVGQSIQEHKFGPYNLDVPHQAVRVGSKAPSVFINLFPLTSFVHLYLAHRSSRTGVRLRWAADQGLTDLRSCKISCRLMTITGNAYFPRDVGIKTMHIKCLGLK